jgi:hypothetical protein
MGVLYDNAVSQAPTWPLEDDDLVGAQGEQQTPPMVSAIYG